MLFGRSWSRLAREFGSCGGRRGEGRGERKGGE